MKVFFVKYNDPIYVKLEKLDIMIRLASQANIAQVNKTHPHTPTLHLKQDLCLILYVHTFLYYTTQKQITSVNTSVVCLILFLIQFILST